MKNDVVRFQSMVACLRRDDGSVLRAGAATHLIAPTVQDKVHVTLGAGCGDWGVCFYLSLPDAIWLNGELARILVDLKERA
jgi:hypothetical protein